MRSIHDNYVAIIHADNGKEYSLHNDGGNGPMSTGTDEWSEYGGLGKIVDKETALKIAENPNRGYGKAPDGQLVIYRIVLNKLDEKIIKDDTEAMFKASGLAKLSDAEKEALGLK